MSCVPQADLHLLGGPHRLLLLLQFKLFKRCNGIVGPLKGIVTERSRSLTWPVPSILTSEAKTLEQLRTRDKELVGKATIERSLATNLCRFATSTSSARYLRQATETWGYGTHLSGRISCRPFSDDDVRSIIIDQI